MKIYDDYYYKQRKKNYIGWSRCSFYEDYGIIRCYSCNKFDQAKDCKGEVTCPICSENDQLRDCKLKLKLSTDHGAWDKICPSFLRILELQKRKFINIGKK